jgi:hypothetical protein
MTIGFEILERKTVAYQAALYGLIIKARDLGLSLIAVTPVDPATCVTN